MHLLGPQSSISLGTCLEVYLRGCMEPDHGEMLLEAPCEHLHAIGHHGLQAFIQGISPQKFSIEIEKIGWIIKLHYLSFARKPFLHAFKMILAPIFSSLSTLPLTNLVNCSWSASQWWREDL